MRKSITQEVEKLICKFKTADPKKIVREMGIHINYCPLGETLGFTQYSRRERFININCDVDEGTQQFTLSHELGHIILHKDLNTPFLKKGVPLMSVPRKEREANEFAIYLPLKLYEEENGEPPLTLAHACIKEEFQDYLY